MGSSVSDEIGDHFKDKVDTSDRILHKVAHGVAGGGLAAGLAALTKQDVGSAAAAGAMIVEIVSDILSQPLNEELYEEVQEQQAALGRELSHKEKYALFSEKLENIALISKLSDAVSGLFVSGHEGISVRQ